MQFTGHGQADTDNNLHVPQYSVTCDGCVTAGCLYAQATRCRHHW